MVQHLSPTVVDALIAKLICAMSASTVDLPRWKSPLIDIANSRFTRRSTAFVLASYFWAPIALTVANTSSSTPKGSRVSTSLTQSVLVLSAS